MSARVQRLLWAVMFSGRLLTADLFVPLQPQEPRKGHSKALIIWAAPLLAVLLLETLTFKQAWPKRATCVGDSAARGFCQLWWSVLHSAASQQSIFASSLGDEAVHHSASGS